MPLEYETQVVKPADGRTASLPKPAINLAQRLTQMANDDGAISVQVIIIDGAWHLILPAGHTERLGES